MVDFCKTAFINIENLSETKYESIKKELNSYNENIDNNTYYFGGEKFYIRFKNYISRNKFHSNEIESIKTVIFSTKPQQDIQNIIRIRVIVIYYYDLFDELFNLHRKLEFEIPVFELQQYLNNK